MKLNEITLLDAATVLIIATVLFMVYSELVPEAQDAGDTLNETGVPLGGLFTSQGVVFIILMAALLILYVKIFVIDGFKS